VRRGAGGAAAARAATAVADHQRLAALRAAGLDDLNLSLDALDPACFERLRGHAIGPVLEGIAEARRQAVPLKLNCVLIRGQNDTEIVPLTEWAMARGVPLRFIEYMPLDAPGAWSAAQVVTEAEVLAALGRRFRVERLPRGADPAAPVLLDGHYTVGLVSTVSNPFCSTCDRLRLTARGELYTCLFARHGTDLGTPLRAGAAPAALLDTVRSQVWRKDAGYAARPAPVERPILMHGLGG
jgi:GTP 3',8-cyclase